MPVLTKVFPMCLYARLWLTESGLSNPYACGNKLVSLRFLWVPVFPKERIRGDHGGLIYLNLVFRENVKAYF